MIKRPLNDRFSTAVREGRKVTTIRQNPWPVGVPIMLYNWSGAAYRSKHADVAAIIVENVCPIALHLGYCADFDHLPKQSYGVPLWQTEGFESADDMKAWFVPILKPGHTMKHLMRFRLLNAVFTVGHEENYDRGIVEYGAKFQKLGRRKDYPGGFAVSTPEDAERLIDEQGKRGEWAVYALAADWEKDTVPSENGWWHALVKSSRVVRKIPAVNASVEARQK